MMKYAIENYRYYGYIHIQCTMEKRVESKLNQAFFTHFLPILKIFKVKYGTWKIHHQIMAKNEENPC